MLNMDMTQRVLVETADMPWIDSPSDGVRRKYLERESPESGHTTSIVRFAPGSRFSRHTHPMGEEILVLEGVFSDEFGDYPAGSYIRNPPGSAHSPFSGPGCTLLVKLEQFAADDRERVVIDTGRRAWQPGIGGLSVKPLHDFEHEHTALVHWPAGELFQPHRHYGGEEIYVLSGTFQDEHGSYPPGSWLRCPHMSQHHPFAREETVIWVKVGHLAAAVEQRQKTPRLYSGPVG